MDRAADGMTSPSLTDVMNTYQGLPLARPDTGSRYCYDLIGDLYEWTLMSGSNSAGRDIATCRGSTGMQASI